MFRYLLRRSDLTIRFQIGQLSLGAIRDRLRVRVKVKVRLRLRLRLRVRVRIRVRPESHKLQ